MHFTLASGDVDLCLVPEVTIELEGDHGCLPFLMRRVAEQGHAVVVVAEGAGEELLGTSTGVDASGNKKLPGNRQCRPCLPLYPYLLLLHAPLIKQYPGFPPPPS